MGDQMAQKDSQLTIALPGVAGRMGRMLAGLIADSPDLRLAAASESPASDHIGQLTGDLLGQPGSGVVISADPAELGQARVIIDFTRPEASMAHLDIAAAAGAALVIGTTGLTADQEARLANTAKKIPILYCANTSVGVTLLGQLVRQVAARLAEDWDIEIVETHHNRKVDAPSGTALALGKAAAAGRGVLLEDVRDSGRDGDTGARRAGDIGFAVMRGGDVAGEHSVIFYGPQERLELTHKATSRVIFGRGALRAARWLAGQKPGLYSMDDVLA